MDGERCTRIVILAAAGECVGERGVCVDAGGMRERPVVTQSVMGPCGFNGTVGCSVNGRNRRLEARGGEYANAKRGKEQSISMPGQRPGEGEYIRDKYAAWKAAI